MNKFTPGPWRVVGCTVQAGTVEDRNHVVTARCDEIEEYEDFQGEGPANARLIAAAPELLAALEDLIAPYNASEEYQAKIDRARAVIKKAKGE